VFLQGIEQMYLPVAHAEGKFVARDEATLAKLDAAGQLVLRYSCSPEPRTLNPETISVPYPACPNGAQLAVAGLSDETGRVFGLMPHPERHIDPTQHPRWTRQRRERGMAWVFENAVRFFRSKRPGTGSGQARRCPTRNCFQNNRPPGKANNDHQPADVFSRNPLAVVGRDKPPTTDVPSSPGVRPFDLFLKPTKIATATPLMAVRAPLEAVHLVDV
jgi:hypothetical protein